MFGNGVTLTWDGSVTKLYLNDTLVKSTPYTKPTPNWTAASLFDLGAYEYQNSGGYNTFDDVIDDSRPVPSDLNKNSESRNPHKII